MNRAWLRRHQLAVFFVLAYAITWSAQIPAYVFAHHAGISLGNEANLMHLLDLLAGRPHPGLTPYLLLFSFTFGPTIAGVIVTGLAYGRAGLADLWARSTRLRIASRWIVVIALLPVVLAIISLALALAVNGFRPYGFDFLLPATLVVPLFAYMVLCTGLAEEIGWRGYALPELQRHHTAEKSSWILGIGWGLWHLPSVLAAPYLAGEVNFGLLVPTVLGLTMGIVGWTIVITWIYNNTGSVLWIVILHGWYNTVQSFLVLSADQYVAQVLFPLLPWVIAVWLLRKYGARTLTDVDTHGPEYSGNRRR